MKFIKILFVFFFVFISYASAEKNTCVFCHTDEATLKKLVKVPHLGGEEGEG
ncbi:MAG: hypothetical protein N2202_02555 [Proteobacteria bacterium]|nr:hypothetical protein [Pseudomonadota bacterium]